jgi:hypothetical protein
MLQGLFDRPIVNAKQAAVTALDSGYQCDPDTQDCSISPCDAGIPGYFVDITGVCVAIPGFFQSGGGNTTNPNPPVTTSSDSIGPAEVIVNNTVQVTDQSIQSLSDAVNQGILQAAANTDQIINAANKSIIGEIQEDTDAITQGIGAAETNLGKEVTIVSTALAASTATTVAAIGASTNSLLNDIKGTIEPILANISSVIDSINKDVQEIYDQFLQPLLTLYNSTIGTIATLTQAIEQDLKDGISGLLLIPGQLADQLASFDASLQRTVEQLGTTNLETVKSGIDYQGEQLPGPFSAAFASALSGNTVGKTLTTTYADTVGLSSESLSQVSAEAIQGLGTLLEQLLSSLSSTFQSSLSKSQESWQEAKSLFVGLLDGILTLLTTVTAMGSLAAPLIDAAEQQARINVPTTKLDPATIIGAMNRQFVSTEQGISELQTFGYDTTRIQVLRDLSVFLADVQQALDWWYRGLITDDDLAANLNDHNIEPADQTALKAGSIRLPSADEYVRWLNYGFINQDQFTGGLKVLRYDDAQIQAVLATYQDASTPQAVATLDGLLNNSNIGWLSNTLTTPIPERVTDAGMRANLRPDAIQYLWLQHWNLPSVQLFIQSYFRGLRTLTELQARFAIDNIPQELWDDLIEVNRPLIPFRTIPTLAKNGFLSEAQAQAKLAAHGFSLEDQQILSASVAAKTSTASPTVAATAHALSLANAKELWALGGISDTQYQDLLEAHGYTADEATLQMQSDRINAAVKAQKQTLSDTLAEVEAGMLTLDAAITQLQGQGFTQAQIATFQGKAAKSMKSNAKHPSIAQMDKMLSAQLITLDQYTSELQVQGWADPWLSALVGLVSAGSTPATTT